MDEEIVLQPLPEGFPYISDKDRIDFIKWAREVEQNNIAKEILEAQNQQILSAPLSPLPIEGTTVEEVTASAQVAIDDLATQMEAKIQIITGQ